MYEIRHYLTANGVDLFQKWLNKLRDANARVAIDRRTNRMTIGNFGDRKFCRDGVWELRIDVGPGYRVYYALEEMQVILLLVGGDKGTQGSDIERACECWRDWQRRANDERSLT